MYWATIIVMLVRRRALCCYTIVPTTNGQLQVHAPGARLVLYYSININSIIFLDTTTVLVVCIAGKTELNSAIQIHLLVVLNTTC